MLFAGAPPTADPRLKQLELLPTSDFTVPDSSAQNVFMSPSPPVGTPVTPYFDAGEPSHPVSAKRYPFHSSFPWPGSKNPPPAGVLGSGANRLARVQV